MEKIEFAMHEAPDRHYFLSLLDQVWISQIHTNNGPMVKRFENEISKQFKSKKFAAVNNGTLAIEIALKLLKLTNPEKNLVLTTPFTYIATIAAIKNSGLDVYYVDIDEIELSMDPTNLQLLLNKEVDIENVLAILPVHPFNNLAKIEIISGIAHNYNIPVIYDASHAIGAKLDGSQSTSFGTFSTVSFHATKTLSTGEGGGLFINDPQYLDSVDHFRAFGFNANGEFKLLGTNGKMSELHAIHGLSSLKNFESNIKIRKNIFQEFTNSLQSNIHKAVPINPKTDSNFGYFPIISTNAEMRERLEDALTKSKIGFRRYFYPSLELLVPANGNTEISKKIAETITCIPLRANLCLSEIERIKVVLEEI
jgi:dTDP-4-amino-4,6-dideoxygalactose transaminase